MAASNANHPVSFESQATLVLIRATVLDRAGHPVTGLTRENFALFDEGEPQELATVAEESEPVSAAIVFDASESMSARTGHAREALARLLAGANSDDEYCLITVGSKPELAADWTTAEGSLQNQVLTVTARGNTALLDAIDIAFRQFRTARHDRRMMIVISDGEDNASRFSEREITRRLEESDVELYAINLYPATLRRQHAAYDFAGRDLLTRLSERTAGRYFAIDRPKDLDAAMSSIEDEMRWRYVLSYTPPTPADGRFHRVRVKVKNTDCGRLSVYVRRGYRSDVD